MDLGCKDNKVICMKLTPLKYEQQYLPHRKCRALNKGSHKIISTQFPKSMLKTARKA